MLIEQQIAERRDRASGTPLQVLKRPTSGPYGDYTVKSGSGRTYRVAVRGPALFENYCSCPDFAVNALGTCKHIEALLLQLRRSNRKALETAAYKRMRASIALQYGDTIEVRLHLSASPSPALRSLATEYFDPAGLLRPEHYRQFAQMLEALRNADSEATIYSDVLEYIDWENELAEGLERERRLLAKLRRGQDPVAGVLKTKLLPYQMQGALFAACRGRVVLADDMGLGKTVQALAASELLRRRKGIERVLVIAPASVSFAKLGRKTILQAVKEIFANQPGRPKPVIADAPGVSVTPKPMARVVPDPGAIAAAAAGLAEAGVKFIESIASEGTAGSSAEASGRRFEQILSECSHRTPIRNARSCPYPCPSP